MADLHASGIERVCMEATGVYWIALHELLEEAGLEVCLAGSYPVRDAQ